MKINTKRVVSVIITAVMMVVMLPSFAMGESGKKYTETLQPEGWTLVENEGGATLSYTKGGGVDLIEVDGYAFKDLDRDGLKTGAWTTKNAPATWPRTAA